jgi:hypothetical protein
MTCASRRLCSARAALCVLLVALLCAPRVAAKPRIRVGDDLDDVADDEEPEEWREWGKHKEPKKIQGACALHAPRSGARCDSAVQPDARRRCVPPPRRAQPGGYEARLQACARLSCSWRLRAHLSARACHAALLALCAQLQLSIVSIDAPLVKQRHGTARVRLRTCAAAARDQARCLTQKGQAMLVKWSRMMGEAGLRGKHVTFEAAGESQARVGVGLRCCRAHAGSATASHICVALYCGRSLSV